jgi:prepilin-type processing-associated H-X9-DG protein
VIAILAALLLPVLNRGKIAADSAACKSNLRQWGLALRMYVDESAVYPPQMSDTAPGDVIDWPIRLKAYSALSAQTLSSLGTIPVTSVLIPDLSSSVLYDLGLCATRDPYDPAAGAAFIRRRHSGRWNRVFCDGHVQLFKTRELFDYHSDPVLQRWNRDNLPHRDNLPPGLP